MDEYEVTISRWVKQYVTITVRADSDREAGVKALREGRTSGNLTWECYGERKRQSVERVEPLQ